MKKFNVTGLCVPGIDYMADTSAKIAEIRAMVEAKEYFTINCPRQYGKTTTLYLLEEALSAEYTVISISFEAASDTMFADESSFCKKFVERCAYALMQMGIPDADVWKSDGVGDFDLLGRFLTEICRDKKYVLLIDEVDKSSNNRIFLKFLGMLRDKYLLRKAKKDHTFHSVILAGVHNVKNIKIKMEQAGYIERKPGEASQNSPWNIAANFEVDMSLSVKEIASMLTDYENDHHIGMNIEAVATEIRAYTNGYPYLVSRICQKIDTELDKDWTVNGVARAIKIMLLEKTDLIDDISKNLANHKGLNDMMFSIIALGRQYKYDPVSITVDIGLTYGFLIRQGYDVTIGNKFFELLLYNHYAQKLEDDRSIRQMTLPSEVVSDGRFNMTLMIEKFAWHYHEIYRKNLKKFVEDECRILFITYLQPLINGAGFYHVESETRDAKRMDVVVDYGTDQFIIELKLWYGDVKHEEALDQIVGYLNSKNKDIGYLLTFDFRKTDNVGEPKVEWVTHGGKKIFDVIVGVSNSRCGRSVNHSQRTGILR